MINFPYVFSSGGAGAYMDLDPYGYHKISGETSGWVDNKANPLPFNWGIMGGIGIATQGENGIDLTETACIEMPVNYWLLASEWEFEYTFNVSSFNSYDFSTFWAMAPIGSAGSVASISYRAATDRLYYTIGETGQGVAPIILSDEVVVSPLVSTACEDNGFKAADIIGNDITIKFVKEAEYMTVYVNDSPRIKVLSSVVSWYGKNGYPICGCFRFGVTILGNGLAGFNGTIKRIKLS